MFLYLISFSYIFNCFAEMNELNMKLKKQILIKNAYPITKHKAAYYY